MFLRKVLNSSAFFVLYKILYNFHATIDYFVCVFSMLLQMEIFISNVDYVSQSLEIDTTFCSVSSNNCQP